MDQTLASERTSLSADGFMDGYKTAVTIGEELGSGSFGIVRKAVCDGAPCAAKIIHKLLVPSHADDKASLPIEQFLDEIRLALNFNHPNIVRCLGVHVKDAVSQMPILLMELMDCSLTSHLEAHKSVDAISYNEELSICHDIVLALEFLHSFKIVHRDLSSNNILLMLDGCEKNYTVRIAKVGDFGMAKVYDLSASTPNQLSECPGTHPYMPPEALTTTPSYTEKIDCFSFGVLIVQILTRLCPDPKKFQDQFVPMGGSDPSAYRLVHEVERRKFYIDKIDSNHSLLPIAETCLSNNPDKRPSAICLCENIKKLKSDFEEQPGHRKIIIDHPESSSIPPDYCIIENTVPESTVSVEKATKFTWSEGTPFAAPCAMSRYNNNCVVNEGIVYLLPVESTKIYAYDTTRNQWTCRTTSQYLGSSLTFINNELTTIGGKRLDVTFRYKVAATAGYATYYTNELCSLNVKVKSADWTNKLPSMPTRRAFTVALNTGANLIVAGGVGGAYLMTVEIMDIKKLQWMTATNLPQKMWGASGTLCGDSLYLLGGCGENNVALSVVFTCSVKNLIKSCESRSLTSLFTNVFTLGSLRSSATAGSVWKQLTDMPVTQATCVSVHDCVLAIGGKDSNGKPTADIHMYNQVTHTTWLAVDHIPSARYSCFAIIHDNKIFVIGGNDDKGTPTNTMSIATITSSN